MSLEKRDLKIDTLKGIVIILMVIAHVIGTTANDGLKVTEDSMYRWFYCLTENYFLPIFMSISGYLYAVKPMSRENVKKYLEENPEMMKEIEEKVRANYQTAFEKSLADEEPKSDDE